MSSAHPRNVDRLLVRWTIGDVRSRGFEMLRLSIVCAMRLFGPQAKYVVCVNTVPVAEAEQRTGVLPGDVEWLQVTAEDAPLVLRAYSDEKLIEGMGWKLVPLRLCHERYELAIDNDCILWALPAAMQRWLESETAYMFAEDVERSLGSFDPLCPPGAINAGIRGLPPGRDLGAPLAHVLNEVEKASGGSFRLTAEIDEQGLQAAAMCCCKPLLFVRKDEVSICSPFWPCSSELGTCGAHFVGLNAPHIPWNYYDRPADE
jgi:hypothetical protein